MSIVYYLMNEYVRKYRIKPIGPHRELANKLFGSANSPAEIEVARSRILEKFPDAAIEADASLSKRFIPKISVRNLRKLR